jgi:signal transduction histidine kinase
MSEPDRRPPQVLCVVPPERAGVVTAVTAETALGPVVSTVEAVAGLLETLDSPAVVDCVVTAYDLPDGTATDVRDALAGRRPDVPVVLLVEPTEGRVPVEALSGAFSASVPTSDGVPPRETLSDALEAAVADAGQLFRGDLDDWQTDASKANVLTQLFEKLPLHVFVKDHTGRIVFVTEGPVDERLHPLAKEFRGKRDIDGVVPLEEAIDSYVDDLCVVETGESLVDKEEFFASSSRWFLTSKVPLHDEDDEVVGLLGVAREVTDRKERERQLAALSHLVRHNLRTDVNIVKGWAERLLDEVDPPLTAQTERIVNAAERLHSTIDNQQDLVDVVTERSPPATVDAVEVVRSVLAEAADQYPDVRFEHTVPDTAPVRASERLGRALGELVENSVVHNPREDPLVAVSVEEGEGVVRISVADSAPPIAATEVAILTGDRQIDALYHSTGLGLWLVNWVVRRSGGELAFAERDPCGNVVTLTLTADDGPAAAAPSDRHDGRHDSVRRQPE